MFLRREPDPRLADVVRRRLAELTADPTPRDRAATPGLAGERVETNSANAANSETSPPAGPSPRSARIAAWLRDRMPATLQGRIHLGPAQIGVLAIVVALGLASAAWWVLRTDDEGALVPVAAAPTPAGEGADTPAADPPTQAPASATGVVVVDVEGKIARPGITTLPAGSRVADAVAAAGGAAPGTDTASVNLARVLVDGEQILVGVEPPQGVAASSVGSSSSASALVSLNSADAAALDTLPGVGPVTAQAILKWREENGPFGSVDDLLEISGIGEATLAKIAPFVTL